MTVAEFLRAARLDAGLSQAELARRAGTSQPAVARYESGAASPAVRTLDRLLHATGRRLTLGTEPVAGGPPRPGRGDHGQPGSVLDQWPLVRGVTVTVVQASDLGGDRMRRLGHMRPAIERAVRRAGARNLRIFGSVARSQDGPESDVDILVDFDVPAHGALPLVRLRRELSELLGERVDLATTELLRPEVAREAVAEAVPR
jgi:predicted nucleotidyltransferase/DNA-binding XRE family transcriptional regulator